MKEGVRGRGKGSQHGKERGRREIGDQSGMATGAESNCASATHHSVQPLVVGSTTDLANASKRRQSHADIHDIGGAGAAGATAGTGECSDGDESSVNGAKGRVSHGTASATQSMLRVGAFDEEDEAQPDHSAAQLNKVVRLMHRRVGWCLCSVGDSNGQS